jgi:hypothetical protein
VWNGSKRGRALRGSDAGELNVELALVEIYPELVKLCIGGALAPHGAFLRRHFRT